MKKEMNDSEYILYLLEKHGFTRPVSDKVKKYINESYGRVLVNIYKMSGAYNIRKALSLQAHSISMKLGL